MVVYSRCSNTNQIPLAKLYHNFKIEEPRVEMSLQGLVDYHFPPYKPFCPKRNATRISRVYRYFHGNILTSHILSFYQFRHWEINTAPHCSSHSYSLSRKKIHLNSIFPRAATLWKDSCDYTSSVTTILTSISEQSTSYIYL